jgi:hypothetical protein
MLVTIGSVVVAYLLLVIVLTWAMRVSAIRWGMTHLNKHVLNPVARRWAGNRLGIYACVMHVGRRSNRKYFTPVLAAPLGDGFVLPLPYGMQVDWFRNVLAAGSCTLTWKHRAYALDRPEVIGLSQTGNAYPWPIRGIFLAGGVTHHVVLHQVTANPTMVPASPVGLSVDDKAGSGHA